MTRYAVAAIALLALAGCTTTAQRTAALDATVGRSEAELVRTRGAPSRVDVAGRSRVLTYDRQEAVVIPGSGPSPWGRAGHWTTEPIEFGAEPPHTVIKHCRTAFDVVDGKVFSWTQAGDDCAWLG